MSGRSSSRFAVEDAQQIRRPTAEQLPVLFGRAEQPADDRDRIRLTNVGDEFTRTPARERVDEPVDDLTHVRTQTVGRLGRERRGDQPAQPPVLVALRRQDGRWRRSIQGSRARATPGGERRLGASADRGGTRRSPRSAGSSSRSLIRPIQLCSPASEEHPHSLRLRRHRHDVDRRDVELVDRSGHGHQVRGSSHRVVPTSRSS